MVKTIKQVVIFPATTEAIYEWLMDSKKHSKFTGARAVISKKVGGAFTTYDDYASGKNLTLVPGKKIVQTWRASDWDPGVFSKTTYLLKPVKGGTQLTFTQTGVPDEQYSTVKQGWIDFYWKPLKKALGKK